MPEQTAAGPASRMPVAFVGHGNPMNALDRNRYTEAWSPSARASRVRVPFWSSPRVATSTPRRSRPCRVRAPFTTSTGFRASYSPWITLRLAILDSPKK